MVFYDNLDDTPPSSPKPEDKLRKTITGKKAMASAKKIKIRHYEIDTSTVLGRGSFAIVRPAVDLKTGQKIAVKIIGKQKLKTTDRMDLQNELSLHQRINHPNIIKILNVLETSKFLFIFMELMPTDLYQYLFDGNGLDFNTIVTVLKQLVSALLFLHKNGIAHRDVKLENILIDPSSLEVKLCDFGFATHFAQGERLDKYCGSPYSVAPEIVKGQPYSGPKADSWSLGSVLYSMISGCFPFQANTLKEVLVRTMELRFQDSLPCFVHHQLKQILEGCLCYEQERLSIAEVQLLLPPLAG